jgi:hypothetical protein
MGYGGMKPFKQYLNELTKDDWMKIIDKSCDAQNEALSRAKDKEKIAVYESLLHDLHFAAFVTMDNKILGDLLSKISAWSYAHRQGNGEFTDAEVQENIDKSFDKLKG